MEKIIVEITKVDHEDLRKIMERENFETESQAIRYLIDKEISAPRL